MADNFTRVFVAVQMPDKIIKEIAKVQEILSKKNFSGKMTELANLHLTLKFMGEVTSEKLEEIRSCLREIKFNEFEVKLGKVGIFGRGGMPRIVWIKLEGEGIWELQKKVDCALEKAGFEKEDRFMSHITIARIRHVNDQKEFADFARKIGVKSEAFKVGEIKLKKSELARTGPTYTDLDTYYAS